MSKCATQVFSLCFSTEAKPMLTSVSSAYSCCAGTAGQPFCADFFIMFFGIKSASIELGVAKAENVALVCYEIESILSLNYSKVLVRNNVVTN